MCVGVYVCVILCFFAVAVAAVFIVPVVIFSKCYAASVMETACDRLLEKNELKFLIFYVKVCVCLSVTKPCSYVCLCSMHVCLCVFYLYQSKCEREDFLKSQLNGRQ